MAVLSTTPYAGAPRVHAKMASKWNAMMNAPRTSQPRRLHTADAGTFQLITESGTPLLSY